MSFVFCWLGFHSWPRVHGSWREPVVEPAEALCRRCARPISSVWRTVYPLDGSRCGRSCPIHGYSKTEEPSRALSSTPGLRASQEGVTLTPN